ncbi:hypothetical protein Tsubulata_002860 [Turnera subulata]|uniref:Ferric oxidoreductase domain-containing protein n=1 Tax=Turnera subulata TaxID=218843 RepID=A0A9Q0FBL4_9ROSI|nr:hypothetical protein Tsubulata_002860 [Turnera subulata]
MLSRSWVTYCLLTAKGAAETLKFNMALMLLPVCRNTITWLRSTRMAYLVPFDDNINFHKTIAAAIVAGVVLHAGNHLACDFPGLINSSDKVYREYLIDDFGNPKPTYAKLARGAEGVTSTLMKFCFLEETNPRPLYVFYHPGGDGFIFRIFMIPSPLMSSFSWIPLENASSVLTLLPKVC